MAASAGIYVKDSTITFAEGYVSGISNYYSVGYESMFTKYGFMIPLGSGSAGALEFFDTGIIIDTSIVRIYCNNDIIGALLTHDAKFYIIAYIGKKIVMVPRWHGSGCEFVESTDGLCAENILSGIRLGLDPIRAMTDRTINPTACGRLNALTMQIPDIVAEINKRGLTTHYDFQYRKKLVGKVINTPVTDTVSALETPQTTA